jgi:hypothetical protein
MEQWAETNNLSYSHLYQVLNGRRDSAPLIARVEQFTTETLAAHAPAALSA